MIAYYTTEIEVEVLRTALDRMDGRGAYEYQLYMVDAEVDVDQERCVFRCVTGLSKQIDSGEEIPMGVDELPPSALVDLNHQLAQDDVRRAIFDMACAVEAEMADDVDRRARNENDTDERRRSDD